MSDSLDNEPSTHPELERAPSAEARADSPAEDSIGLKVNKKRERELSLEPSSSKEAWQTSYSPLVPSKKNRVDSLPPNEDDEPASQTPPGGQTPPQELSTLPVVVSPQHESKVKQIRKRVEGMTWQDEAEGSKGLNGSESPTESDIPFPRTSTGESRNMIPNDAAMVEPRDAASEATANDGVANTEPDPMEDVEKTERAVGRPEEIINMQDNPQKRKLDEQRGSRHSSPCEDEPEASKRSRDTAAEQRESVRVSRSISPAAPAKRVEESAQNEARAFSQQSGFLAFASTTSPLAKAAPGPTSWSTTPPAKPFPFSKPDAQPAATDEATTTGATSLQPSVHPDGVTNGSPGQSAEEASSKPKPVFGVTSAPGVGFTGFTSFASPFAKVDAASAVALTSSPSFAGPKRSKSPSRGNAFTPYNTANRGFGTPKSPSRRRSTELPGSRSTSSERNSDDNNTRSKKEREPRSMSFTEKLLEEQDDDHRDQSQFKINLQEQEVFTGEEDERTVFSVRGKLYTLGDQHQWKERGVGPFKLNVRKSDGAGARLVMRKEGVHSLVLNVALFTGMKFDIAQDPRYVRFAVPTPGRIVQYNLRCSSANAIEDLVDAIREHIPES